MYTVLDVVNVKSDYIALKKSFAEMSQCMDDICALMCRLEYFIGHYEDVQFEDDLPL